MQFKRILSLCLCSVLLLGIAGCDAKQNTKTEGSGKITGGSAEKPKTQKTSEGSGTPEEAETVEKPETIEIPQGDKYIAFTFDDGPTGNTDGRTERLLDGLKERGVHATFFLCGYRVRDFNSMMNRYLAEGHEVGNHTMDHIRLDTQTNDGGYAQVSSNNDLIASYTGQAPTLMRPVGGAYNDDVIASMKKLGMPIILWNIDTLDWKYHDDAAVIQQRILDRARDGAIVLEHDLYEATLEGVLAAIDELQAQGYAFVTVSELAKIKGITLEPGKVYTGFTPDDTVVESGSNFS
ncbi:MAG: polysaccharide deacetylase family protein [Eubacteriales bacterium]|nr:polysaccharide deacetylase family protein [Eubacteriales bacterium]